MNMLKTYFLLSSFFLFASLSCEVVIQDKMMPQGPILNLSDEDLLPSIQQSSCLLLDVYAEWCKPCKLLQPVLAHLSLIYKDTCIFAKIDGYKNQKALNTLKVNAYPTLIFFKDGKEVARIVGFSSQDAIEKKLNEVFK